MDVKHQKMMVTVPINILVMGTVVQAAPGCLCPENTLLDPVIRYINLRDRDGKPSDIWADVDHSGRVLMQGFNQAVLDTDPMFKAVQVVKKSVQLVIDPDIRYSSGGTGSDQREMFRRLIRFYESPKVF
jgi:CO dehydrogenase nickel-insertion accessory protein CooC1